MKEESRNVEASDIIGQKVDNLTHSGLAERRLAQLQGLHNKISVNYGKSIQIDKY